MRFRSMAVAAALTATAIGATALPAQAAPPAANEYYYTVASSYQGAPEDLWEVATRFLGDPGRAGEILDLNSGRVQPDGRRLGDPSKLRAGWRLVLPWDAVGTELSYGQVPAGAASSSDCARSISPASASWAQNLLTPSKAWPLADGTGVKVAIVDSGVDGSAPGLAGQVLAGTDVAAGAGRGDTGCAGSGTALAGIVVGKDGLGVAPGARVIPVKVATAKLPSRLAATSINVAAAAGAQVILVGSGIDATDPEVAAAVSDAISRDVVVVLPASAAAAAPAAGLLRVGTVAEDEQPADDYPADAVDLRAPGVGVATIGPPVTGDEYAAAFVAGTVALVRSAHPELHAADVTKQVLTTAANGLVSPVAAVTTPLPAGVGVNAVAAAPSSGMGTLSRVLLWIAVLLAVLMLLPFVLQRPARMVTGALARRSANRQAQLARARLANDNDDPFWDPPAGGLPRVDDDITEVIHQTR